MNETDERDPYNLQRFVEAQEDSFAQACEELREGQKRGHWMWYIFPQIQGLGHSSTARKYSISSLDEARAYLNHPILGPRLRECCQLVLLIHGRRIEDVFGYPDCLKLRSSLTLFAHASDENQVFKDVLAKYYRGEFDGLTLERI